MMRKVILAGLVMATVSGCASIKSSRFNPLNWFGKSEPVAVAEDGSIVKVLPTLAPRKGYPVFTDTRPLVPSVSSLVIERSPSGAIIKASATLPALGYYDAQLVPVETDDSSVLTLDFRIRAPQSAVGTGSAGQRHINVARAISHEELAKISRVVVRGAQGSRQARR